MEKKLENGVLIATGITATAQVRELYAEVVNQNIEKYVAITTQNVKFKYNPINDCAEMLAPTEEFALNPSYRKIEVAKIDELIPEQNKEIEKDEDIDKNPDIDHEPIPTCEQEEQKVGSIDEENTVCELTEEEKVALIKGELESTEEQLALAKERATTAEAEHERIKEQYNQLIKQIKEKDAQIEELSTQLNEIQCVSETESEPATVDGLFALAKELGFKIWISPIEE